MRHRASTNQGVRLAALAVAGLIGAAIYYIQVVTPKRARAERVDGVAAWSKARAALERCLFQDAPSDIDAYERVLLQELAGGPRSFDRCREETRALEAAVPTRSTAEAALDQQWREVGAATVTYRDRIATFDSDVHSPSKKRMSIAESLRQLDELEQRLRRAAGLTAPAPAVPRELPGLELGEPIADDAGRPGRLRPGFHPRVIGSRLTLDKRTVHDEAGALAFAIENDAGVAIVTAHGQRDLRPAAAAPGLVRAPAGWLSYRDEKGLLRIAILNDEGAPLESRIVARPGARRAVQPVAAGGDEHRFILYLEGSAEGNEPPQLRRSTSSDAGATWTHGAATPGDARDVVVHRSWPLDQVHVVWNQDGASAWLPLGGGVLTPEPGPHPLPAAAEGPVEVCFGQRQLWFIAGAAVARAPLDGAAAPTAMPWTTPAGEAFACSDDELIGIRAGARDTELTRCHADDGCAAPWQVTSGSPVVLIPRASGGFLAGNVIDGLLVLYWLDPSRGGRGAPISVRQARGLSLAALAEWNGLAHALLEDADGGLFLAPAPLDR